MNIVLIRPDRIGDCVIGSVAINDLRSALPDAEIFWVVRKPMAALFAGRGFPAKLVVYDEAAGPGALAEQLKKIRPDAVVLLNSHPLTDAAAAFCGAPVRIGYKASLKSSLTGVSGLNKDDGRMHEAEYARDLLRLLPGVRTAHLATMTPCVVAPAVETEWQGLLGDAALAKGFFVVHPGAHGTKTRLPMSVWAEVSGDLSSKTGYIPVLVGEAASVSSEDRWPASVPAVDLRGKLSLGATARLLASAKVCLSRDSGPAHVAAAMGCPTVCVFMENTPAMGPVRWTPIGAAVRTVVPAVTPRWYEQWFFGLYRKRAVGAIRPDMILTAAESLLP
jgi:ADP-heptose:LPS heptosyltransferase